MTATTARRRTGAIASALLGGNDELVSAVKSDFERAEISEKLKALLAIAGQVQQGGKHVQPADIERARRAGASDRDVHDTVLIAAAFCMYNRYVDGLATWAPTDDREGFRERAARVARKGYNHVPRESAAGAR
jgi:alkylhydroperoxidase/carboxymuconolactone decarboxylase family protein YurZ